MKKLVDCLMEGELLGRCQLARWLLSFVLIVANVSATADAPERIVWDKRPISVQIQIGRERIIHFPDEVRYWLPDSIKHKVSALAANGVVYIKALESFPKTRVRVQALNDQQVYLLDVTASDLKAVSDELIVMIAESVRNRSKDNESPSRSEDWRIRLTRYAAQQLYAPERLLGGDSKIKRVSLEVSTPVPLIRGGLVKAIPVASWQGNGLTVTAVRLTNSSKTPLQLQFKTSTSPQELDLSRGIRGDWLSASVQHDHLASAGGENDTTTLYLISGQSFLESLNLFLQGRQEDKQEPAQGTQNKQERHNG